MNKKQILIIHIGLIVIALTLMILSDHFEWDAIYVQLIPLILAMLPQYLPEKKEKEVHHHHHEPISVDIEKKAEKLTKFYKALKLRHWEDALELIQNPINIDYFKGYFPNHNPKFGINTCNLKSFRYSIVLCNDPEITNHETKESPILSKDPVKFNQILQNFLQDFIDSNSDVVIDSNFELDRFKQMIDTNQVHELMKNIEQYTKIFQREEFAGLIIKKKKQFKVRLESYSQCYLHIWFERPDKYRIEIVSFINKVKKENSRKGCTMDFHKGGSRTFYPNNGHNEPQLFDGLINTFFTQAKEDIL